MPTALLADLKATALASSKEGRLVLAMERAQSPIEQLTWALDLADLLSADTGAVRPAKGGDA